MWTVFFIKKHIFSWILRVFSLAFVVSALAYAAFLSSVQKLPFAKSFYFLVSQTTKVEVGIFDAQLEGGAGYFLEKNGKQYVALSVYFNKIDARAVENRLRKEGREVALLSYDVEGLYFKCEKEKATFYKNALESLYVCLRQINLETQRLDKGATQQSSVKILRAIQEVFQTLYYTYKNSYSACAQVCQMGESALQEIVEKTIYAKDLRHLLCELVEAYLDLTSRFHL